MKLERTMSVKCRAIVTTHRTSDILLIYVWFARLLRALVTALRLRETGIQSRIEKDQQDDCRIVGDIFLDKLSNNC